MTNEPDGEPGNEAGSESARSRWDEPSPRPPPPTVWRPRARQRSILPTSHHRAGWAGGIVRPMARRPEDLPEDPSVVLVDDGRAGDMDAWLASLLRGEPTVMVLTAAELVAEARSESV